MKRGRENEGVSLEKEMERRRKRVPCLFDFFFELTNLKIKTKNKKQNKK